MAESEAILSLGSSSEISDVQTESKVESERESEQA